VTRHDVQSPPSRDAVSAVMPKPIQHCQHLVSSPDLCSDAPVSPQRPLIRTIAAGFSRMQATRLNQRPVGVEMRASSLTRTRRAMAELTRRAMDGVNVARDLAGVDNRVDTRQADATRAFHAPEGIGTANEPDRGRNDGLLDHGD
jgi:hypothetical protein